MWGANCLAIGESATCNRFGVAQGFAEEVGVLPGPTGVGRGSAEQLLERARLLAELDVEWVESLRRRG